MQLNAQCASKSNTARVSFPDVGTFTPERERVYVKKTRLRRHAWSLSRAPARSRMSHGTENGQAAIGVLNWWGAVRTRTSYAKYVKLPDYGPRCAKKSTKRPPIETLTFESPLLLELQVMSPTVAGRRPSGLVASLPSSP